ncbi:ribosome biogenesis protein Nop53/GLTSCR2 [Endogone sp. FLAS-F59071]|nr:ribosome biogenesis protein Nop53/GLTSCR2 [Endogone sp. FLAS-F59071]|eukprot:RUS17428.1 ribosome biogenesis protein Nop53/GLTSCR2 [Endogone sp. FLAS-F59071]
MAAAQSPQKKKSQPSRKGKKAWRKNVDITDLEEDIEEKKAEERLGGKLSERSNESLFMIDTQGDAKVKRALAKNKPLRMDEILAERTAIPAVASRPGSLKPATAGKSDSVAKVSKYTKRKLEELVRRKRDVIGEPTGVTRDRGITEAVKKSGTYDVWGETQEEKIDDNDFLRPVKKIKVKVRFVRTKSFTTYTHLTFSRYTIKNKLKPPPTISLKPKPLLHHPAVKIPPPGASYNPTMQDHQALLRQAHEDELARVRAREAREATEKRAREAENIVEGQEKDDDEETGEEEEGNMTERAAAKEARKTRTERNRQLRAAERQREEEKRRRDKAIRKELGQVEEIKKTLEATVEEKTEEARKRTERREKREREQGARLAKQVVKKQPIDVQLQEELAESLRTLKVSVESRAG